MTPPIVKRYLIALDQHKWIGIASIALVVGAAGILGMQPAPPVVYKASGALAYNRPPVTFSTTGTQIQEQGKELTEEILLANNVIKSAAARVKVDPEKLKKQTNLKLPGEDGPAIIVVSYVDSDGQRAGASVEGLMQAMVEQSSLVNSARLRSIIDSISARIPAAKQELRAAENKLEEYIRKEGPAILAAQDGTILGGITGSENQQRQIQIQIDTVKTQMQSIQQKLGLTPIQAYASSALSADPIIGSLRNQIHQTETQIKILSRDYRPEHPQMIQLNNQLLAYNKLLQERATEVIRGDGTTAALPTTSQIRQDSSLDPTRQQMANQLVALQTQLETLQQQLQSTRRTEEELRKEYVTIPNKQLEQARLQQQVQLKQGFYDKMLVALSDAQAAEAETVSSLSIAQPPEVEKVETKTMSLFLMLGAGGLVGIAVGGGLIFLLSMLDNTCYSPQEIRGILRQRDAEFLGELPFVAIAVHKQGDTPILQGTDSHYLEAYEKFRSQLLREKPVKVLVVTSALAREGKTVTAYNLAITSALAGKRTLLIEADLRSPSHSKYVRVAPDPAATLEPLRYYGQISECIRLVPDVQNLYIVPSPGPVRHAAAILESSELRRLIEDARGRFDLVVLDAPSLSQCNDALMLENYSDGILLVTRPGYTQQSMLEVVIDQLNEDEDLPLIGVVINGADMPDQAAAEEEEMEILEEEQSDLPENIEEEVVPETFSRHR